jgi:hypothetical protein
MSGLKISQSVAFRLSDRPTPPQKFEVHREVVNHTTIHHRDHGDHRERFKTAKPHRFNTGTTGKTGKANSKDEGFITEDTAKSGVHREVVNHTTIHHRDHGDHRERFKTAKPHRFNTGTTGKTG